jgi:hypothetical protein
MKLFGLFSLFFLCTAGCLAQDFNLLAQSLTTLTESFGSLQGYLEGFKPKVDVKKLEEEKGKLVLKLTEEKNPQEKQKIQQQIDELKKEIENLKKG